MTISKNIKLFTIEWKKLCTSKWVYYLLLYPVSGRQVTDGGWHPPSKMFREEEMINTHTKFTSILKQIYNSSWNHLSWNEKYSLLVCLSEIEAKSHLSHLSVFYETSLKRKPIYMGLIPFLLYFFHDAVHQRKSDLPCHT